MSEHSANWRFFYDKYGNDPVSVCHHVRDGTMPRCFGKIEPCFLAGCCDDCLYTMDRSNLLSRHLFDKWPELVALSHLPIYGLAIFKSDGWLLDRLDVLIEKVSVGGVLGRTSDEFLAEQEDYFYLEVRGNPLASVFSSGARFFPAWQVEDEQNVRAIAEAMDSDMPVELLRSSCELIVRKAIQEGHNYLCVPMRDDLWEYIIINPSLNAAENTLRMNF